MPGGSLPGRTFSTEVRARTRARVDAAKRALDERWRGWWDDGAPDASFQPRLGLRLCRSLFPSIGPPADFGSSSATAVICAFVGKRNLAALLASSSLIKTNFPGATLTRFIGTPTSTYAAQARLRRRDA